MSSGTQPYTLANWTFLYFITFKQTGLFSTHFFWRFRKTDRYSSNLSINNELFVTSASRGLDFNHLFINTPSFHCLFIFILLIEWTHYHRWMLLSMFSMPAWKSENYSPFKVLRKIFSCLSICLKSQEKYMKETTCNALSLKFLLPGPL